MTFYNPFVLFLSPYARHLLCLHLTPCTCHLLRLHLTPCTRHLLRLRSALCILHLPHPRPTALHLAFISSAAYTDRCLTDSYMIIDAAAAAFSDSILPSIGISILMSEPCINSSHAPFASFPIIRAVSCAISSSK